MEKKNDAEVKEYGGKIWINQGQLGKILILQILLAEHSNILTNFKK